MARLKITDPGVTRVNDRISIGRDRHGWTVFYTVTVPGWQGKGTSEKMCEAYFGRIEHAVGFALDFAARGQDVPSLEVLSELIELAKRELLDALPLILVAPEPTIITAGSRGLRR